MANFKKACAWILSALMSVSVLPQVMAEEAQTAYAWVEAEDFTVLQGAFKTGNNEGASNGKHFVIEDTSAETASVSCTFTVPETAEYELDILSTKVGVDYLSNPVWKLDDGEFASIGGAKSDAVFTVAYGSLNNQSMFWYTMGKKELQADTQYTLTLQFPRRTGPGNTWNDIVTNAFDAIAVVPTDWAWIPEGINKPSLKLNEYVVLNGANFYANNGYTVSDNNVYAFGMLADYETAPEVTYKVAMENAGNYEIWVDCEDSYANGISLANSATSYAVGEAGTYTAISANVLGETTQSIYNPKRGVSVNCGWQKAGKVKLSAGMNTLKFKARADAYSYWSVIRKIIVVPASYAWNPTISETPEQQELPAYAMLNGNDYSSNVGYEVHETGVHATKDVQIYTEQGITPELVYEFLLAADDKYDIWVDCANQYAPNGATAYAVGENGTYTNITNTAIGETTGTLPNLHRGVWVNCAWRKAGTVSLSAGSNILKLSVGQYDGYQDYWSMIRRIVVAPSAYNWKPTISEIPSQQPIPEYIKLGASEFTTASGYTNAGGTMKLDAYASAFAETPKLTYDFVVANTAPYDIWINCGNGNNSSWYPNAYAIGTNAPQIIRAQANGASTGVVNMFSAVNVDLAWKKVDTVQLRKGRTLTLSLTPGGQDSFGRYWSTFKEIAIVPAAWNWSPNQSATPCQIENNNIIWVEAESMPGLTSQMEPLKKETASSGAVLYKLTSEATNISADRVVTIPKAGDYSIYALASNPAVTVYTDFKVGIDGTYTNATQMPGFTAYTNPYDLGNGINITWLKLGDVNLSASAHSIGFACDETGADGRYIFGMDAFMLVPKNDSIDLTDLSVEDGIVALQKSALKLADDLNNVTADLTLPTVLANETTVTWASDNAAIDAATGAVTRGTTDQAVTLTATFSWLNAGTTYTRDVTYNVTVPGEAPYTVADFAVDGELVAGATLTASATVTNNTEAEASAILAIALYKGNDIILVDVDIKGYTDGTAYSASITLPDDITGCTVKTILWDMATMSPMADAI